MILNSLKKKILTASIRSRGGIIIPNKNTINQLEPGKEFLFCNYSGRTKLSKKEVSEVRFEGVCGPDGHGQAPRDGFMASLKANF